jgi:hypothetical protein
MPIPALLAAALPAIGSAVASTLPTLFTNKQQQNAAQKSYDMQRRDALSDWRMNNEYNSPQAQMQRFKDAGLNPNLIYGQQNTAQPVRSTNYDTPKLEAPTPDLSMIGGVMAQSADTKLKEAQTNNLIKQNTVIEQDALLRQAQTAGEIARTTSNNDANRRANELQQFSLQAAEQNLRKTDVDISKTKLDMLLGYRNDWRQTLANSKSLEEANARIASMAIQNAKTQQEKNQIIQFTENLKKDGTLKQLDIDLRRLGIMPSDNIAARLLGRAWNGISKDSTGKQKPAKTMFKEHWNN